MRVTLSAALRPTLNGALIEAAPTVCWLHSLMGPPDRISSGRPPAPAGHRNNQRHVYDSLGVYFSEHHHTRRLTGCELVFRPEGKLQSIVGLTHSFAGSLEIAGEALAGDVDLPTFFRLCPVPFKPTVLGWILAEQDGFSVLLTLEGRTLSSGRRSKSLALTAVSLSWPHDPWGAPAGDG